MADTLRRAKVPQPDDVAVFVLTVMEGAVMQARAHRSLAPFDTCIRQLRLHLAALVKVPQPRRPARRPSRMQVRR